MGIETARETQGNWPPGAAVPLENWNILFAGPAPEIPSGLIRLMGFNVHSATTEKEAIAILEQEKIALAIIEDDFANSSFSPDGASGRLIREHLKDVRHCLFTDHPYHAPADLNGEKCFKRSGGVELVMDWLQERKPI